MKIRSWRSVQDLIRRERVVALMRAASSPKTFVRRDVEQEVDDETGRLYRYELISLHDHTGRGLMTFVDDDGLGEFLGRVARLKRRHQVVS